jgi:segregation and condensation protein B
MNRVVRLAEITAEAEPMSDQETPYLPDMNPEHLRMVEALLFAAAEPLAEEALARSLPQGAEIRPLLEELQQIYARRGVNLVQVNGKWQFRTAADLSFLLRKEQPEQRRLSRAAIETLAIVAYHQPVTRAEIEAIRGVALARGMLDRLLEAGWVRPAGRRETPGRPLNWTTTPAFLAHFGLDDLGDLPGIDELRAAGLLDIGPIALGESEAFAAERAETGQPEQEDGNI